MKAMLDSWQRKYYAPSDGEALLFYVAFGDITPDRPLNRRAYRCQGVPEGFELLTYDKVQHSDYIAGFLNGLPWERLAAENPGLAENIDRASGCVILRGSQPNPQTLDYLRDCVGMLTFLLDNGVCAIWDPQMIRWWSAEEWREQIFKPAAPVPHQHVVILYSEDEGSNHLLWVHTRGMRKFGRPDISVRRIGPAYLDAVIDLCQRYIEYQAYGGIISEGEGIRMASLPEGGVAHHAGDRDDPDFNNVHIEIVWPEPGLTKEKGVPPTNGGR